MLDSLLELIAAIFIATIPLLLAVSRGRRRRSGTGPDRKTGGNAQAAGERAGEPDARTGSSNARTAARAGRDKDGGRIGWRGRLRQAVNRLGRRGGATDAPGWRGESPTDNERSLAAARTGGGPGAGAGGVGEARHAAAGGHGPRRESRGTESVFAYEEEEPRQGQPRGAEGLLKRVNRYPPLQRAIVLKEILDNPKGLD